MVCAISLTRQCVTLSTTEAEHVAMAEGVKEELFVRRFRLCLQQGVTFPIELFEDNEGDIAVAENPISSGKIKHINVRWHFIRDFVKTKAIALVHRESVWQRVGILTKALLFHSLKGTHTGL